MIALDSVTIRSGGFRLEGVSLRVPKGGYGVVMGSTGSGKTTLLEAIAGLRRVEAGAIHVGGVDVTRAAVSERRIGLVPQEGAVFPRMTVRDNLAFPLKVRGRRRGQIDRRVAELAERLAIVPLLGRRAAGLSGGERQRVALGRALASEPVALLLDEPLSALDEPMRDEMIELLKETASESGVTTLHVTHNRDEARRLASAVFEIVEGRVVEQTTAAAGAIG